MMTMPDEVRRQVAALPERVVERGELVLQAGGASRQLMFLKQGAVDIEIEDQHLIRVSEPGAVLGDIAILLDRPHTADVRAASRSILHVADDPEAFLRSEPAVLLHVARLLAERLNAVNHLLIESRKRTSASDERGDLLDTLRRVSRAVSGRLAGGNG